METEPRDFSRNPAGSRRQSDSGCRKAFAPRNPIHPPTVRSKLNISKRNRLIILVGYWIGGFLVTHVPMPGTGEVLIPNLDKVVHFFLYLFLSLLMAFWLGTEKSAGATVAWTLGIGLAYAVLDEGAQTLIPSRHASVGDWIADSLGVIVGCLIYLAARVNWESNRSLK